MLRTPLLPSFSLASLSHGDQFGEVSDSPGLQIERSVPCAVALIEPRLGCEDRVSDVLRGAYGVALTAMGRQIASERVAIIWSGLNNWLVLSDQFDDRTFATKLQQLLRGIAAVWDQSGSRLVLRLSGSRTRDTLSKLAAVDLRPRVFRAGDVAITIVHHIPLQLWRPCEQLAYDVAVPRSMADSFAHHLLSAGAEFGVKIVDPRTSAATSS